MGANFTEKKIASDCLGEPQALGCYQIYNPVCGCNGVTYANGCEAVAAGIKSFV